MVRMFALIMAYSAGISVAGVVTEDPVTFGIINAKLSCDDDLRVHKPVDITWDDSGLAYLLCAGSCRILVIDDEFEVVGEIGRCGEGPGEIENAATIEVVGERVFIFQGRRVDVFDLSGTFLDRVLLRKDVDDTAVIAGNLLGTTKDGEYMLLSFDADGNVLDEFGPACKGDTWDERYLKCGTMNLLNDDGQAVLLDPVFATVRWKEGNEWVDRALGLDSGGTWREGGAAHKRFAVNAVCGVPGRNRLLMLYMEKRDDKNVSFGLVNSEWDIVKIGETTESVRRMGVSPTGELWLLFWSSEVKVYECPVLRNR